MRQPWCVDWCEMVLQPGIVVHVKCSYQEMAAGFSATFFFHSGNLWENLWRTGPQCYITVISGVRQREGCNVNVLTTETQMHITSKNALDIWHMEIYGMIFVCSCFKLVHYITGLCNHCSRCGAVAPPGQERERNTHKLMFLYQQRV